MVELNDYLFRFVFISLIQMIKFLMCEENEKNDYIDYGKDFIKDEEQSTIDKFNVTNQIATKYIWTTVPILFSIFGSISNTLSIVIFLRSEMRKYSSFVYFAVLNIVNLVLLHVTCFRIILEFNFNIDVRILTIFTCKLHVFLTYFLGYISSLLLSMISIDRVISVAFLQKAKDFCRPKIAIYATTILTLCIFLSTSHFLVLESAYREIGNETVDNITLFETKVICNPRPNTLYSDFINYKWTLIDMCIFALIPFIIMSICSVIIIYKVSNQSRKMNTHIQKTLRRQSTLATINERKYKTRTRNLALMLIPVNILFFVFLTPVVMAMYFYPNIEEDKLTSAIVELLATCNYTFNFFIYFITSSKFREEFYKSLNELLLMCQNKKSNVQKYITEMTKTSNTLHFNASHINVSHNNLSTYNLSTNNLAANNNNLSTNNLSIYNEIK